jgi:chromosome segregation ATPase
MKTIEELEALLEVATRERDEARAEVERLSDASTHWQVMLKRETEEVQRLQVACHAWAEDMREAGRLCEQAGNEMPIDAVRRFVSSKAAIVDMLQDRLGESRSEVDRLTDERDELLVRVADAGAELRATREAYADAYRRGVEAMREAWCRIRALPIPEEP